MKFTKSYDLPGACDEAYAVVTDEEFQHGRVSAMGHGSSATVVEEGDGAVVQITMHQPTHVAPGSVRRFLGDHVTITDERHWGGASEEGARSADLRVHTVGAPITLNGTVSLRPDGEHCRLEIDGDLRCSIPLVGKSLEGQIAGAIGQVVDEEAAAITQRLRG